MSFSKHSFNLPPLLNLDKSLQIARWFARPLELMEECYAKLGSAFTLDLGQLGMHAFFCDPAVISTILKEDSEIYYTAQDKNFLKPLFGEYSLFALDNQDHLQRRRNIAPVFHHNKIYNYSETIKNITLQTFTKLSDNSRIVLHDYMLKVSLEIILKVIFGLEENIEDTHIKSLIERILKIIRSGIMEIRNSEHNLSINKLQNQFTQIKKDLDFSIEKLILSRIKYSEPKKQNILNFLINIKDDKNIGFSIEEIKDHLITLLIAGHETTATALTWAIYWIHTNPHVLQKLQAEILSLTEEDLIDNFSKNTYLLATCQETLRIMPVITIIARALKKSMSCGDYLLPEGTNISIPIYLLHRNPKIYPEPERFNPERFLERKFQFNEYMPFGGGPRICIGMFFALYQMKIILTTFLKNFEVILEDVIVQPIRKGLVISPAKGLSINLRKRKF